MSRLITAKQYFTIGLESTSDLPCRSLGQVNSESKTIQDQMMTVPMMKSMLDSSDMAGLLELLNCSLSGV